MHRNDCDSSIKTWRHRRTLGFIALLFSNFIVLSFIGVLNARADTVVGGIITSDTTWTLAGSPYIVATESVSVTQGVKLTIEPGVVVRFNPGMILWVNGTLDARGTASNPITFTSNQPYPAPGDWGNIDFRGSTVNTVVDSEGNYISGSILKHCVIEYGGWDGVQYQNAVYAFGTSLMIDNCLIENNSGSGIMVYRYDSNYLSWITNNTLRNNNAWGLGGGIILRAGVIENNVITGNNARNGVDGGGIYAINADVIDNIVTDNTTKATGGTQGGGMYISAAQLGLPDTILIQGNVIQENHDVNYGAGIYIKTEEVNAEFIVENNIISGNAAITDGGGIYIRGQSGVVNIQGNVVMDNTSDSEVTKMGGGGIFIESKDLEVLIKDNFISGNSTLYSGGGIYIDGFSGNVTVQNNIISNNLADSDDNQDGNGGGIYCDFKNGAHILQDNVVTENISGDSGGGIYTDSCGITGNLISNNSAVNAGGGIVSSGDILSNTISANNLSTENAIGSGVLLDGNGEFLYNSVIDNTAESGNLTGGLQITGTPQVHHNNLYGNLPFNVVVESSKTISGTLNYWGTDMVSEIEASIYDYYDDDTRGEFIYYLYLTEPEFKVPLSPPYDLTATLNEDQVTLSWEDPNQDFSDGWGYNIYYDIDSPLPPYEGVGLNEGNSPIDVGDQKTATLSGLEPYTDYYFGVTVYDDEGRESLYATIVVEQPDPETVIPLFFLPLISH